MKAPLISDDRKKELSAKLKELLLNEHMFNAPASRALAIRGEYIAMMLNPKYFHKPPAWAWKRIDDLVVSGESISNFSTNLSAAGIKIVPEKAAKKTPKVKKQAEVSETEALPIKKDKTPSTDNHLAELLAKLDIYESRINELAEMIKERNRFFLQRIEDFQNALGSYPSPDSIQVEISNYFNNQLKDLRKQIQERSGLTIFQKNIYK